MWPYWYNMTDVFIKGESGHWDGHTHQEDDMKRHKEKLAT